MPGAFGTIDWTQTRVRDFYQTGATISVPLGTEVDTMPASNVFDPQPSVRARILPSGSGVTVLIDLGSPRSVGVLAVVNTTSIGTETLAITGSATDPTGLAADAISYRVIANAAPERNRGAWIVLLPANVDAQYIRLRWYDLPGGYFDIGRIAIMQTLRLERGTPLGWIEGRMPLGLRDANPFTGVEFPVAGAVQRRFARFSLPRLTAAEYAGTMRDMLFDVSVADDVLWIPDVGLSQDEMHARAILGGVVRPGDEVGITRNTLVSGAASFTVIERV